jgi:outer membrane protein assembly factor BamA
VLNLNITIVKTKLDFLSIYSSIIRVFSSFFVLIFFICGCTSQVKKDEVVRVVQVNFEGNRFIPDQKLKKVLPVKEGDQYI